MVSNRRLYRGVNRLMHAVHARDRILIAAKELFSKKGYEQVTVREIAREAGCSHTSIYAYFDDKKKLLEELAKEPLALLMQEMNSITSKETFAPLEKLVKVCKTYVHFGLNYRNLYEAFMHFEASRVDIIETKWELNKSRLILFGTLKLAVSKNFPKWDEQQLIAFSRIVYYMLHGIIMTYKDSDERVIEIEKRVLPLVTQSVHYLVKGVVHDETS